MKPLVAVLAGFIATSMIFVSGGAVAMYLFMTTPSQHFDPNGEVAALWSPTPTDAKGNPRSLRVIPAKAMSDTVANAAMQVADASATPQALIDLPNACLLPHVASASVSTRNAMADLVVDNLAAWLDGRPALTPVPECQALDQKPD